jgi:hypothetical protein
MGVVFDEVIVNVEALPAAPPQDVPQGESAPRENDKEKIIDIVETQQRWARRLLAD